MTQAPASLFLVMAACCALGLLVPELVRRVPEPPPEPPAEPTGEPPAAKETYAAVAARPGLAAKAALAAALAGAVIGAVVGAHWPLLYLVPLVPICVALAVIDWRTSLLPTRVIAPTYVLTVGLVLVVAAVTGDVDDLVRAGWGWLIAGGSFLLLWFVHPAGLGYGDVRLSGILGIALGHLGWGELLVGLYAGFLLGGLGGGLLALLRVVDRRAFPFGPFMLVGALAGIAVGEPVLRSLVEG
ncbi:A24 family peptidase [Nocardioides sp. 503]|uniref:prepilin peptidase n=1 Tax=Nocardioides sp. 503 TaxID=2508326 RepID=UPI00106F1C0D|nr:A24 family peptidase [Nocardioides sp. 503]